MTATHPPPRPPLPPLPSLSDGVHPPPFLLPGEHFAAALLWLATGAAGLVVVAPHLAAGNIFDPRVFAVTHCFTIGFITTVIFGALYQLFPVTMGAALRSLPVAHLTFWLLQAGTVLVTLGFWHSRGLLLAAGWAAIAAAAALFGLNLIGQSLRARPDPVIGRYVAAGYLAFVAALVLGGFRIGEVLGYGHIGRTGMIASHFHLAALGFATFTAVGVGNRMLPMFLVSHGFPRWPLRCIGPLGGAGLGGFTWGQLSGRALPAGIGAACMAVAVLCYLGLGLSYFRRRVRRSLDPGLAHVALGYVALAVALVTGIVLLIRSAGFEPRAWAAYALLVLLGWLALLILGVLYKILPFLTWLHLFGRRLDEAPLPTVADLTRPLWGWASLACLVLGLVILVAAVVLGRGQAAQGGAVVYALGTGLVLAQAGRVARLRYHR